MDSKTVADFQEASKQEPPRKVPQRAKANYTTDIVVDKVLKYAQKLDENGEYPSYLIFCSSPFTARHFVCLLHAEAPLSDTNIMNFAKFSAFLL